MNYKHPQSLADVCDSSITQDFTKDVKQDENKHAQSLAEVCTGSIMQVCTFEVDQGAIKHPQTQANVCVSTQRRVSVRSLSKHRIDRRDFDQNRADRRDFDQNPADLGKNIPCGVNISPYLGDVKVLVKDDGEEEDSGTAQPVKRGKNGKDYNATTTVRSM